MNYGAKSMEVADLSERLFSEILFNQSKFTEVRAANADQLPLSRALNESLDCSIAVKAQLPLFSSGRGYGAYLEFVDGSVKLDLASSSGPNILGHAHPLAIKSQIEAATYDTVMACNLILNPEALALARSLIEAAKPSPLKHFWFTGSGSFANDNALKIIWQKHFPKTRIFAFQRSFAGKSIATQNLTHLGHHKEKMPTSFQVDFIPMGENSDQTIAEIDSILSQFPGQHCAIMVELVQGHAGFYYQTSDFYKKVFSHLKKKGIAIWVDEVQTFARTPRLFAFQHFQLEEFIDIVTIGKALQVSGVLYREEYKPKEGLISSTFTGPVSSILYAQKILNLLTRGHYFGPQGRIMDIERHALKVLSSLESEKLIEDIQGIGTMFSFRTLDGDLEKNQTLFHELFNRGVILMLSKDAGSRARMRMLLPLVISENEFDSFYSIFKNAYHNVKESSCSS